MIQKVTIVNRVQPNVSNALQVQHFVLPVLQVISISLPTSHAYTVEQVVLHVLLQLLAIPVMQINTG